MSLTDQNQQVTLMDLRTRSELTRREVAIALRGYGEDNIRLGDEPEAA
ncbi:hypothetical protein [Sphaerothrix gracilis]